MLRLAGGEKVETRFEERGHSIEARLCAEDPGKGFQPSAGLLTEVAFPEGARCDHWVGAGTEVSAHYDSLLGKVIVHAPTRPEAVAALRRALDEVRLAGIETNLDYLRQVVASETFAAAGGVTTGYLAGFAYAAPAIDVIAAGTQTTVQDWPGRVGYWEVGIPPSGPMDALAFRLANRVVGNPEDAAGLEMTVSGPTLRFNRESEVALAGAAFAATLDGVPVAGGKPIQVPAGGVLQIGSLAPGGGEGGARAYLAIRGGLDLPRYLGSRATFTLGQFGGHGGRALRVGDVLRLDSAAAGPSRELAPGAQPAGSRSPTRPSSSPASRGSRASRPRACPSTASPSRSRTTSTSPACPPPPAAPTTPTSRPGTPRWCGGSSSGSAVAVARGLVAFALGTDTAGSGRVPAALNELVGLKPSFGLLSCAGVVPACRSLDCVSFFARTAADAAAVFAVAAAFDPADAYSRPPGVSHWFPADDFVFATPPPSALDFFGCDEAAGLLDASLRRLEALGGRRLEIDFAPFLEAALLLYEGPWVSERYAAIERFLLERPGSLHPVTRAIISGGGAPRAVDAFRAHYRLRELKAAADRVLAAVDLAVAPTIGRPYTVAEVTADPVTLNSNLGRYTNFMNLLDLSACAVPAGRLPSSGVPWGVTFFAPAFADRALLALAERFLAPEAEDGPGADSDASRPGQLPPDWIELAVCGAHMRGLPLNPQLAERGARFLGEDRTAPEYRMFALPATGGLPPRPGLLRVAAGPGASLPLERWALPAAGFGTLAALVAAPLGFGKVVLASGREVTGFLCESRLPQGTIDITENGGWRRYLESRGRDERSVEPGSDAVRA